MKVLLADDHALFRDGVRLVLENLVDDPLEIIEAADFTQAIAAVKLDPSIDVGLVDLNMPGSEGANGIDGLRRAAPNLHLVVVSGSSDPRDVRRAFDAGAQGYIAKASSSKSMVEGIRSVLSGETYLSPGIDAASLAAAAPSAQPGRTKAGLTPRQRDVLAMVSQGKSNKEIARDLNLAEITVKLHVTAILRALGVENRTQAAILAGKIEY
ncbi:LuxR C-terminal-related transcriptional regulator [Magnetospirillum moscoviense]|uniref:DNA-binding response regulator n=1 Tax=Magnetospirillum moscoviense TaxID=1437059 RepID=A0A178MHB4_9PROT|nr:response regulator transcription factor [Magnetospirillum moscoviense]MBF0325223.1 response regulator transcription factor [Alphaproteobacteria bacterium]OAN47943.1 DNA-binding response regulator [Magnetospirillum moscoviense]